MHLTLSKEDIKFRDEMRRIFTTHFPDHIREAVVNGRELTREQTVEGQQILNSAGIAVPHWPIEWGGRGWSDLRRHIWLEEMYRAHVPPPLVFNTGMIGPVLAEFGTEEQKQRFLPATANLDIWWSQGFSEPEAGSDLASLKTTAVSDGDDFVVNGQKTWTTLGQHGDWLFTLVRTDPSAKKQRGISMLLIDMTLPGVTVRPIELIDGRHEVNEVWLEDVRVPQSLLVGELNDGWTIAKFLLGNERVGIAPMGGMKAELCRIKQTAKAQGSQPAVELRIADLENELLALELTALRITAHSGGGEPHPASSVMKLKGTELQQAISELEMDLAGPGALTWGAGEGTAAAEWERHATPHYLNLRKVSIYGGSNEIQRQIIARAILGL
ncbi:acyl-CoA dehydrogenase [Nocardioides eburneiflavus]|uniref:Acyl-CoA dehydrogenase n=1 Tax=Nocardioides eburneiflavus TaxID=2518372 RepID=A0A4Z1BUW5_9ACTN|nr:acyl-CoA dehydrogenase family protein [Nocardioides eburneiflavus]TGN65051.1 acyl-CoA dehydrogenase [Nocardioides eburneiflavus]